MSPPSSKKAKKGKAAATPKKGGSGNKPELGIYTGLMFVAFTALVCGIVILVLQLGTYGWQGIG
jgi:hypothetical protein